MRDSPMSIRGFQPGSMALTSTIEVPQIHVYSDSRDGHFLFDNRDTYLGVSGSRQQRVPQFLFIDSVEVIPVWQQRRVPWRFSPVGVPQILFINIVEDTSVWQQRQIPAGSIHVSPRPFLTFQEQTVLPSHSVASKTHLTISHSKYRPTAFQLS